MATTQRPTATRQKQHRMQRPLPSACDLGDRGAVRAIEVRANVYGRPGANDAHGPSLTARWERWEGALTADGSSEPNGKPPRSDFELVLGIRDHDHDANWDTGHDNGAACAILSAIELDVRVIRGYGLLLQELADIVEQDRAPRVVREREANRRRAKDIRVRRRGKKR